MWINVTLNVIIKSSVTLSYCKPRGDMFLLPFLFPLSFFFTLMILQSRIPTFLVGFQALLNILREML